MIRVLGCIALWGALSGCAKTGAECEARLGMLERRLLAGEEPTGPAKLTLSFDTPTVPRAQARPFDSSEALLLRVGYARGAVLSLDGFGALESYRAPAQLDEKTLAPELERLLETREHLVLYVAAPNLDHRLEDLDHTLSAIDGRVELRFVVGIEGSEKDPVPEDGADGLRARVKKLPGSGSSERYSEMAALMTEAFGSCEGVKTAVLSTRGRPARDTVPELMRQLRGCGCRAVDVPQLETSLNLLFFGAGVPERGWVPLELSTPVGTVQQWVKGENAPIAAEPGLGALCERDTDCAPANGSCRFFDARGELDRRGQARCTRPCGAGCPRGFRCARELIPTGMVGGQLQGIVELWCGKVEPRIAPVPLSKIPRR